MLPLTVLLEYLDLSHANTVSFSPSVTIFQNFTYFPSILPFALNIVFSKNSAGKIGTSLAILEYLDLAFLHILQLAFVLQYKSLVLNWIFYTTRIRIYV